jgi:hypothetical protein
MPGMKTQNEYYRVELNARGAVAGLYDKAGKLELISEPSLAESWRLLMPLPMKDMNPQANYLLSVEQAAPRVREIEDGLEVCWPGPLKNEQGSWPVSVTATIRLAGPEVRMQVSVDNHSGLMLAEVWFGGLGGLMGLGKRTETETLIPEYNAAITASLFRSFAESLGPGSLGGQRFPEFHVSYPNMSMPWMCMYNPRLGRCVYYGCHEAMVRVKTFHAEMHPAVARLREGTNWPTDEEMAANAKKFPPGLVLHWVHLPFSSPGKSFQSATVVVRAHEGDWHDAAKHYRQWFTSNFPLRKLADAWYRREQAVQDTVFMLPEGNICKTYKDIPALARGAAKFGVKTIMVSGWWRGGHDNQYPNYAPDERLGTWEDLRRGIAAAHKLGVKVVFFSNVDTVDTSTPWFKKELHKYQAVRPNGTKAMMNWGMGTLTARMGITAPPLSSCDPAFPQWREIIVSHMRRLAEVGADGVHFDKLAAWNIDMNPACPLPPDQAMYQGALDCILETLAQCRKLVPHFAVGVEASWDRLLSYADGWWNWIDNPDHVSSLKYTFPEFMPNFAVVGCHDYNAVNSALRYAYQILVGPIRWSTSMDDPQMAELARYIKECIRVREQLKDTIFLGDFMDQLEAMVAPKPSLKWNTHRNPATGRRACVLANYAMKPVQTTVKFDGNKRGRARIYRPFEKVIHTTLPAKVTIAGERFAVVVEEQEPKKIPMRLLNALAKTG